MAGFGAFVSAYGAGRCKVPTSATPCCVLATSTPRPRAARKLRSYPQAPTPQRPALEAHESEEVEDDTNGLDSTVSLDELDVHVRNRGTDSSLLTYLKEIGSVSMLDNEEVTQCSKNLQKLLLWEQAKTKLIEELSREPTDLEWANSLGIPHARFVREKRRLRMSKDRLVAGNLRLVVSIAKRYVNQSGLNLLDLIQEGSLGLIRGAERYDAAKGFRFSTYTSWWIRQSIQRAVSDFSRQIRLPPHLHITARKAARLRKQMFIRNLREPTEEELATALEITVSRLRFVMDKSKGTDTVSLDKPVRCGSGEDVALSDMIMDKSLTPEQIVTQKLLRDDLENVLSMLTETEKQVMRMRYGFDDGFMKNHEEIASMYSVPSVKIRQIEARAMRKLRHPNLNNCLREYVCS